MKEATHLDDSINPLTLVPTLSKAERISDYLGVDRALIEFDELDINPALLYGKFDSIHADDVASLLHPIRLGEKRFSNPKSQGCYVVIAKCNEAERLISLLPCLLLA